MKKIDFKKIYDSIIEAHSDDEEIEEVECDEDELEEDAMVAAGDSGAGLMSGPKGDTTTDILGKCKHNDGKGFFDKDCFHIPKPVFKKPLRRFDIDKKKVKVQLVSDNEK